MAGVLDDAEITRILAITAHPDDVDFGAAGTIARWTDAGIEVTYCLVTDGDAGGLDEDFPRAEMPHGGFKHSGYGKDLSMYGFEDYTRIKHVMSALD